MAIPFFEPKTTTTTTNNNNSAGTNNANSNALATTMHYDQVDGLSSYSSTTTQPPATSIPPTAMPSSIPSIPITNHTTASASATIPTSISISTTSASLPATYEQQTLAWKILALALCKALKEYYQQTSSSKDAFTNQTVQVLPNGKVQPLWK